MPTDDLFKFDLKYAPLIVAGVDEAGRGPLAGSVVCAAAVMPAGFYIDKINDSKAVKESVREELFEQICLHALDYCIFEADNRLIDAINILEATKFAMKKAIEGLTKVRPDVVLVDAVKGLDIKYRYEPIIKGDALSYNIAAASILAKVWRDRLMRDFDKKFPEYGFARHKGYGTKEHIDAIIKYGKCEIHRDSFLKNIVAPESREETVV